MSRKSAAVGTGAICLLSDCVSPLLDRENILGLNALEGSTIGRHDCSRWSPAGNRVAIDLLLLS